LTPVWDDAAASWVAARIPGCGRGFGACRALAVVDGEGRTVAGVVFHDWNPERGTVELSGASTDRRWMTRAVLAEIFRYVFAVARVAVARTSARNEPVRRLWRALGASEHLIPELWGPGEACAVHTLTRPQWQLSRLNGVK
jgi:hypothetical protein